MLLDLIIDVEPVCLLDVGLVFLTDGASVFYELWRGDVLYKALLFSLL